MESMYYAVACFGNSGNEDRGSNESGIEFHFGFGPGIIGFGVFYTENVF
ncbi:MAG: hypothetical protein AAB860_00460 [Patescibacteria group bacterium]